MSAVAGLNTLWRLACHPAATRFARALAHPGEFQRARLMQLLRENSATAFGRQNGFSALRDADAFRANVPVQDWTAVAPWVERVRAGEHHVLTRERVTRLVPTAGSSGGAKLIPWTAGLAREFQAGIAPWVVDLPAQHPASANGPAYWSVSPLNANAGADSAIPVGFDDDSAYVGNLLQPLVAATLAVPSCLRFIADPASFRYATLRCLLATRTLALISVWHPSFLDLLLEAAPGFRDQLLVDIARGGITPPRPLPPPVHTGMKRWLRADPVRAEELRQRDWRQPRELWPQLAVVSCWGDGAAAPACAALQRRLAGIAVQPKGLLASEGVVTIPHGGRHVLAVTSHVHEFIDDSGRVHWADDLQDGHSYEVLLTTAGGLYRYRLGDRVRVTGFAGRTPCLRFLGRGNRVVDQCGEKLDEAFVAECLAGVVGPAAAFALLAPDPRAGCAAYTLYLAGEAGHDLLARLDDALGANPHYLLARRLGQLAPPRLFRVTGDAHERYAAHVAATATCLGAVKPVALHHHNGWSERFAGHYHLEDA
jgi:hypothetical protein